MIEHKTVIMIAHRMRTVAKASHLIVLKDGVIEEEGTPEALMAKGGMYKRMFDLQQAADQWKI